MGGKRGGERGREGEVLRVRNCPTRWSGSGKMREKNNLKSAKKMDVHFEDGQLQDS